jgi:hypothetical protein
VRRVGGGFQRGELLSVLLESSLERGDQRSQHLSFFVGSELLGNRWHRRSWTVVERAGKELLADAADLLEVVFPVPHRRSPIGCPA